MQIEFMAILSSHDFSSSSPFLNLWWSLFVLHCIFHFKLNFTIISLRILFHPLLFLVSLNNWLDNNPVNDFMLSIHAIFGL